VNQVTYLIEKKLFEEKDDYKTNLQKAEQQIKTESQKHIHTFLAMGRQYERRIAILKEFHQ
jgi:hypothetical protein